MTDVQSWEKVRREARAIDRDEILFGRAVKMRRLERAIVRGYVYGADHAAVTARFFTREGLSELEHKNLGMFMLRLDTGAEAPRTVLVSLFLLAMVVENVGAATKAALRLVYGREGEAVVAWVRAQAARLHRVVHPLGSSNSLAPGGTCLMTCAMRGCSYNLLKTEIYPLLVPRELYLDLDDEESAAPEETKYVYFVTTYDYNSAVEGPPSLFVVATRLVHTETLLNVLRHRFRVARFFFLNHGLAGRVPVNGCLGCLQRVGWFPAEEYRTGVLPHRQGQLAVVRLGRFYVDVHAPVDFV